MERFYRTEYFPELPDERNRCPRGVPGQRAVQRGLAKVYDAFRRINLPDSDFLSVYAEAHYKGAYGGGCKGVAVKK